MASPRRRAAADQRRDRLPRLVSGQSWTDSTLTLKARKLGGAEGFLILFRVHDPRAKSWWNIGGWGNDHHAIEMPAVIGDQVAGRIETNRWYDIRIELQGPKIRCYLDDKLVHDIAYPSFQSLYAVASRVDKTGEVILKVVNVSAQPQDTELRLRGVAQVSATATAVVLTSASPEDENSLDQPTKVAPVSADHRQRRPHVPPRVSGALRHGPARQGVLTAASDCATSRTHVAAPHSR